MEREYMHAEGGVPGAVGSAWLTAGATGYPALQGDVSADVVVMGAGIVGALTAYELASRGLRVVLLERRRVAGGTTGHSTAKITVLHETDWSTRMARRGSDGRIAQWASLNAATPSAIEDIVAAHSIDCGFRRIDAHLVAATRRDEALIDAERDVLKRLGVGVDDPARFPAAPFGDALGIRVADQAQFDPAAFVTGLVDTFERGQVTVAEASPVRKLARDGTQWRAITDSGSVTARYAVMTALAPVRDPALLFTRIYPYAAYAYEFQPLAPPPDGFWIQAGADGITLRPTDRADGPWIAAGQHVRLASRADERATYRRLIDAVESHFPGSRPVRHWSTHDLWTPDWLPYVGRVGAREGLYMIGGFGGWGMSASLPAARLIADAITGSPNEAVLRLLSPNRLPSLRSLPSVLSESAVVARRLLLPADGQKRAPAVDGVTVVAEGAQPPRCTHLGCHLKVDTAEGTLNCPCHGSRFTGDGSALYGPAQRDLNRDDPVA